MAVPAKEARGTSATGVLTQPPALVNPFPEPDFLEVLVGCIRRVLTLRNSEIRNKAFAQVNARISRRSLPVLPPSHEWSTATNRLLFFRYYVEGMAQVTDGALSQDELITSIAQLEIEYEGKDNAHYRAYQQLTESLYGRKFRPPDPPAPERPPELDPETREVIERNQVNQKLQRYMQSLSQGKEQRDKAYSDLVLAYIKTVSDLSVPLRQEYEDQQQRAENHPWIEWLQANDFPSQHETLFPVLFGLLNQAKAYVDAKDIDRALGRLDLAQSLFDRLASLLHEYYTAKVKYAGRVVFWLSVAKSISRMLVSLVVFKNVKGVVSQFSALIAVNLAYQQLDKTIGTRSRGLSGTDAVRDAALEMLMVKVTGKISELMVTRFALNPKGISHATMNMLSNTVIGSMQEEFISLGRGVNFVGFLQNLRAKFSSPEYWIENLVMAVLAKNYTTSRTVSLPVSPRLARAATVATVLALSPKASAAVSGKPAVMEVAPHNSASAARAARTGVQPEVFRPGAVSEAKANAARPDPTRADASAQVREQRSAATSAKARGTAPDGPAKSPLKPLGGAVLGAGTVVGRNPRRRKVLALMQQTRKLLDRINDPTKRQAQQDRLDALRKEYDKSNDHVDIAERTKAVRNKINEIYAEEQIGLQVEFSLPSFGASRILGKVFVPNRGSSGPDIIDMVYKVVMLDGKIGFIVIESKYGGSRLGWVKFGKRWVRQFSPEWFEMRIAEIGLQNASFARELQASWTKGRILPFVVKISPDGSPKGFYDFRKEWTKYSQTP